MQNQLLRDSDVMSMIHGVEIRVPFLDDEVIRLANSIQPETKYAGALPKQFLIDAFWDDIPQAIWDRPKMGFSFPFAKWLSNSAYVKELMVNGNEQSNKNFQNFVNGKMHWSHMMSLVILNHRNAI
jgi:asparagine synthase (glutamine-hydrolysing)